MSIVTLNELLPQTSAIAGLVCLGWEEITAFVAAAEAEKTGVALMVGPGARAYMPLSVWAKMLQMAVNDSDQNFALHLDHGASLDEVKAALDLGFSSVMFDGSKLELKDNIKETRQMVELSRRYQVSSEGEIGFVGYAKGASSIGTDVEEARIFSEETQVDFMAVSVGNVHLQTSHDAMPNWELLAKLAQLKTPLVIHGGSGFSALTRSKMAEEFNVRKFNIGTEIRKVFGASLRDKLMREPEVFDHLNILGAAHAPMLNAARKVIAGLR